ncbi:MAG: DUF4388 domain-containing protein [Acidimicrobiales bacterium]|jgi:hypothetical protein
MEHQRATVDQTVDRLSMAGSSADPVEYRPDPVMSRLSTPPHDEAPATMRRVERSDEAPAASLVGSLSVFALSDILSMLSSTTQTGELQVVGETVDGRVWLDRGELSNAQVGTASTIAQAVFDLACLAQGWFYFTSGPASSNGQSPVRVDLVLSEVGAQVDEWKELQTAVPIEAVVTLCPDPPGSDVQIRSDQWRVLTTIGNDGHTVKSVLDRIGGDQIVGLRTLRDLHAAHLVELDGPAGPAGDAARSYGITSGNGLAAGSQPYGTVDRTPFPPPPGAGSSAPDRGEPFGGLAEVAMMPPPIAGDPWGPSATPADSDDDGAA